MNTRGKEKKRLTTFELSPETALDPLKAAYGTKSNAATLRRALAVALILSRNADKDGVIHLLSKEAEILIPQRG
jgi:hypothetical protein